jgi:glutamate dehydrogenase/leucine dehydrogenase
VDPNDTSIFETPCDIFAPNALGGVINPNTIDRLNCKIVCGAANNQLLDDARDGEALRRRDIVFVPDFVANRMGIVQCANEQYGSFPNDPAITRHFDTQWDSSIQNVTQRVLSRAKETGLPVTQAANTLADELGREKHPLWPDRGHDIVRALAAEQWHLRTD